MRLHEMFGEPSSQTSHEPWCARTENGGETACTCGADKQVGLGEAHGENAAKDMSGHEMRGFNKRSRREAGSEDYIPDEDGGAGDDDALPKVPEEEPDLQMADFLGFGDEPDDGHHGTMLGPEAPEHEFGGGHVDDFGDEPQELGFGSGPEDRGEEPEDLQTGEPSPKHRTDVSFPSYEHPKASGERGVRNWYDDEDEEGNFQSFGRKDKIDKGGFAPPLSKVTRK